MKLSWSKTITVAGFLFLSAGACAQVTRPATVYCFNSSIDENGFNAGAKGWIFRQLGFLGPNGEPPTVNAQGQVVNSAGQVVGSTITNAQGQVIGYRNADGTKEAYDLDRSTFDAAWQRVDANGRVVVAKHGVTDKAEDGSITGTGITLDGGNTYGGFGPAPTPGTGTGSGTPPYPVTPRPGANITLDLNGCYTGVDPDGPGPKRSVGGSASGIPGVGGVVTNPGLIFKGGWSVQPAPDTRDAVLAALRACAFAKNFKMKDASGNTVGDIGAWINSLPFEQQRQAIVDCLNAANVAGAAVTFNDQKRVGTIDGCSRNEGGGTGALSTCDYYLPLNEVGPAGGRMTFQSPVSDDFFDIFFPPNSVPNRRTFEIRRLAIDEVAPLPPGLVPATPFYSFGLYNGQPFRTFSQPLLGLLAFEPNLIAPQLFRLVRAGIWEPVPNAEIFPGFANFLFDASAIYCVLVPGLPPCAADYNGDGGIDGDDVITFLTDWDQGLIAADYNQDGGVDGDDVIAFFDDWDSQCGG